jgi:hypothetical protein
MVFELAALTEAPKKCPLDKDAWFGALTAPLSPEIAMTGRSPARDEIKSQTRPAVNGPGYSTKRP